MNGSCVFVLDWKAERVAWKPWLHAVGKRVGDASDPVTVHCRGCVMIVASG